MEIALDVEGVLADSHRAGRERSPRLDEENCPPPNWSFADEEMLDHYLHVTQNLWHNHTDQIQPMEAGLDEATRVLAYQHNVDVVTNRTGVDEQIQAWLRWHDIHYREFKALGGNKTGAGEYDVFVDDSPHVVQDAIDVGANVFLVDRPYNQDIEDHPAITRVSGVGEAAEVLCDGLVV